MSISHGINNQQWLLVTASRICIQDQVLHPGSVSRMKYFTQDLNLGSSTSPRICIQDQELHTGSVSRIKYCTQDLYLGSSTSPRICSQDQVLHPGSVSRNNTSHRICIQDQVLHPGSVSRNKYFTQDLYPGSSTASRICIQDQVLHQGSASRIKIAHWRLHVISCFRWSGIKWCITRYTISNWSMSNYYVVMINHMLLIPWLTDTWTSSSLLMSKWMKQIILVTFWIRVTISISVHLIWILGTYLAWYICSPHTDLDQIFGMVNLFISYRSQPHVWHGICDPITCLAWYLWSQPHVWHMWSQPHV